MTEAVFDAIRPAPVLSLEAQLRATGAAPDGTRGMIHANSVESWRDAVRQWYFDEDRWNRASTAGREFVRQSYSVARVRHMLRDAGVID